MCDAARSPRILISGADGKMSNYVRAVRAAGGTPVSGYCPPPDLSCAGLLLCGPVQACLPRLKAALYDRQRTGPAQTVCLLALGFASLVLLVSGTYNPFIYFRF